MPVYEFECDACQARTTVVMPITEFDSFNRRCHEVFYSEAADAVPCSGFLDVVFHPSTFVLKGSGWPGKDDGK